eukprot:EG_transcript_28284
MPTIEVIESDEEEDKEHSAQARAGGLCQPLHHSLTDEVLQEWEGCTDLYDLLGAKRTDPPRVVDERYRDRKAHFSDEELMQAWDPSPPGTRQVACLKAILHAYGVLSDPELRAVYDRSGLEGVEEAEQRKKILRRMKELQVSEGDWTQAKQVLQEAEVSREQMRSGHQPPVKPKEPKVCEERRQVRTKLEEAELEYELRREKERQREMELAAER